jgi:hypothetical protein
LATEIVVVETSDAVCYEPPSWQPGQSRRATQFGLLGATALLLGLIFAVPIGMTWAAGQVQDPIVIHYIVPVLLVISLAGLTSSIYALRGARLRSRIELTAHGIGLSWQAGPLRWSRRVVWGEVERLVVAPAWNVPHLADVEGSFLLHLVRVRGRPVRLAGDNDRVRLLALAVELAHRAKAVRAASGEALMMPPPSPLEVLEEDSRDVVSDRNEQPAGSRVVLEHHADGVTITVPSLWVRGCLKEPTVPVCLGLFVALAAWIAYGSATAVARHGLVGVLTFEGSIMPWLLALFVTLMLTYLLMRGAQLSARGDVLSVRWTNLVGTRCRIWHREDLAELRVISERVNSDTGKEWRQYLAIRPRDVPPSAPRFLLSWCEKDELEWIATTLRRSLRLPATQPKPNDATGGWDDEIA